MNYYKNFTQGSKRKILLTKEGLDRLRSKLDEITSRRHKVIRDLKTIDKSDTDELSLLTEIQSLEATEIEAAEISDLLQHVEPVIKPATPSEVCTGCTVGLKNMKVIVTYTIVNSLELDIENNKISEDSAIGRAVMGKKVGDSFSVITPKGELVSYEIVSIS